MYQSFHVVPAFVLRALSFVCHQTVNKADRRLGGESEPNREIVSLRFVRSCLRAVWLPNGIQSKKICLAFAVSLLERRAFPFPLCDGRACFLLISGD